MEKAVYVEKRLVMPFYLICDVSESMWGDMAHINDSLAKLKNNRMADPVIDDLAMLSVIVFGGEAKTVVPLAPPSEIELPTLSEGGDTNFGTAFTEYHRSFEADMARLKAEGRVLYSPHVFFVTDGVPSDGGTYLRVFLALLTFDPATKQGNRAYPLSWQSDCATLQTGFYEDSPTRISEHLEADGSMRQTTWAIS